MKKSPLYLTFPALALMALAPTSSMGQNTFPATGNVGIGTLAPNASLQVAGGDINITPNTQAYRLGTNRFLWHGGNAKNLFVGDNVGSTAVTGDGNVLAGSGTGPALTSGANNTAMGLISANSLTTGSSNSFFGEGAGHAVTSGSGNALFGKGAARQNATGSFITAIGTEAGFSNTVSNNAFLGYQAGYSNTTGTENTFLGYRAGRDKGSSGHYNTAVGFEAGLGSGSIYHYNSFFGSRAGRSNTTGQLNTSIGYNSGTAVTTATHNTLVGANAGPALVTGSHNTMVGYLAGQNATSWRSTFIGYHAGRYTTSAQDGVFVGHQAGLNTSTGNQNVFIGSSAGVANTTGAGNTAVGYQAGDSYATCSNSTFIGHNADANGNYTNAAAIGNGAVVTASNRMEFGNAAITGCYNVNGNWTISDSRFKFNVNENVSGMDFIRRLRPVTYQMNAAELDAFLRENMPLSEDSTGEGQAMNDLDFGPATAMIHAGFLAQEVEQAAIESGFVSSIVSLPTHDNSPYAVSYAQLVVPLVKAVQEQQEIIEHQNNRLGQLEEALSEMRHLVEQCCTMGADMRLDDSGQSEMSTTEVELGSADVAILYQNRPNPFTDGTVISCYLPVSVKMATIVFHDSQGQMMQETELKDRGHVSLTVQADGLSAGIYTYSLTVDGKVVETRRMVKD